MVETAGRNPQPVIPILKDAGIKIIHKCTSVRHALKAQSIGCDAASVDGFECGGHPGEDDIPNMILSAAGRRRTRDPLRRLGRNGGWAFAGSGAWRWGPRA